MDELNKHFLELEQQLMLYRKKDFQQLLSNDYIEFGSSGGKMDKAFQLQQVTDSGLDEVLFSITEFEAKQLAENIVMVTYQTKHKQNGYKSNRSSIWRKQNDLWQLFFHQGTPTK